MWDWMLVYLVVFFFVFIFQRMITFFDPPAHDRDPKDPGKKTDHPH